MKKTYNKKFKTMSYGSTHQFNNMKTYNKKYEAIS